MNARSRWSDVISGQDPAHARLTVALAVTTGVLLSALFGDFAVRVLHAETSLLSVSIMLSVQAGSMVTDATAPKRTVTSALLIPALLLSVLAAAALSVQPPLVSAGFILMTGAAIWVRKYGPRAAAIGAISFMGYFFTLFVKPAPDELLVFCLIATVAAASQLLMRLVLLLRRPRRELEVLLKGLRAGSAAAIHAALPPPGRVDERHSLRLALARLDTVGAAITSWQDRFQTERHVAIGKQALAEQVLDARVDTEEACYERARHAPSRVATASKVLHVVKGLKGPGGSDGSPASGASGASGVLSDSGGSDGSVASEASGPTDAPNSASRREVERAEQALMTILDDRAAPYRYHAARDVAADLLHQGDTQDGDLEAYLLARSAVAHARLRDIDLSHPLHEKAGTASGGVPAAEVAASVTAAGEASATAAGEASAITQARPATAPAIERRPAGASRSGARRWSWKPWHSWAPTTRMAVQATIAALLAAGVGEMISASRWYWAVMTAFVIFIGGNTRSSIFTRAYRRVAGTAIGIVLGVGVVTLAGSNNAVLIAICIVAVFGMRYFGTLSYLYQAIFTTMMLVALYRLLGVLGGSILEVRLIETISGAVIGVLCAYLIFSATSRPALLTKVDAYFDALDALLSAIAAGQQRDPERVMSLLGALDDAQSAVDKTVSAMSAALAVRGPHQGSDAVHDMFTASRAAARLVQAVVGEQTPQADEKVAEKALGQAVEEVRQTARAAQRILHGEHVDGTADSSGALPLIVDHLRDASLRSPSSLDAVLALARIDWALRRLLEHSEAVDKRSRLEKFEQLVRPGREDG